MVARAAGACRATTLFASPGPRGRGTAWLKHLMKRLQLTLGVVVALALAVAAWAVFFQRPMAPAVTYTLLDGSRKTTQDLQGKVYLVNFWATSCVSCVKEMPELVATYEKYREQGFDLVAVAMSYDPPAFVVNFTESRKLPFKVAIDNTGDVARAFDDVQLTPTTFLVDRRGQIVKRYVGEPDFDALHRLVERLLART